MKLKKQLRFSIFETLNSVSGAFQTTPTQTLNFNELLEYYNSPDNKKLSDAIINAPTPEAKNNLKSKRAYYTPYGTFSKRKNANILEKNNIVSIDIDELKDKQEAIEIRNRLAQHPSILFALLSTRGEGVKAMMAINPIDAKHSQIQLREIFKPYLQSYLKLDKPDDQIDTAQFTLSQPCYFSYDADIYINKDATVLDLEFNYKEPERPAFKPTDIPAGADTKIDNYILGALKKTVNRLTPDGSRHPKLATVKSLAQIVHYAPHLENEILETFISAGERMYNSNEKTKIKQVRKNVMDAWNSSINNPINNEALDSIIRDLSEVLPTLVKPKERILKNEYKHKLTTQYIGEDSKAMKLICDVVKGNKFTSLSAGMGMGKTTMLLQLQKMLNRQIIISVPTVAIAQQQYNATILDSNISVALIIEGVVGVDVEISEDCDIIYVTNASLGKLQNIGEKILIVDEAHLCSDRSPINQSSNENTYKVMKQSLCTLFMSGTPNDILEYGISKDFKRIKIEPLKKENKDVTTWVYDAKTTKQKDVIRDFATGDDDSIKFIFMDDKTALNDLKDDLVKLKDYEKNEIVMYSANTEDVEHPNYVKLMEEGLIPAGTKVVLATSKVAEGVNINNEDAFSFLFIGKGINKFLQSFKRPRKAKSLDVFVLFERSFYNKQGMVVNEVELYNNLVDEASRETISPELFWSNGVKRKEKHSISDDFSSRSHFDIQGNNVLNPFEIAHEVKKVKESHYNPEIWQRDIQEKMPEINFLDFVFITVDGDVAADKLDKDRKQIKKEFLNKLKGIYHTPEILSLVLNQSKNDNLKGTIKRHLDGVYINETLTPDELTLFRNKCFKQVSKWVDNTFKLKKITKNSLEDSAEIMVSRKLFSSATFNRVYNRNICILMDNENNPNKSQNEHRLFNKYNKVLKLFKGKETISKIDLEEVFRTKLNYKLRDFNTAVIVNEIGFVFDVKYDRKSKLYHLKKGYKKIFVSLDNQIKVCTNEVTDNQQVNTEKKALWLIGHQTTKSDEIDSFQSEPEQPILEKILSMEF
tara:strand:+ start:206 stop:3328 length:3123 start_codon:yes stop_codon:yes gene_type:complete